MNKIYSLLEKYTKKEYSSHKLAGTFCLGIYIGLSPFIGLRTIITLIIGWLFTLDFTILFAASFLMHNPWTVVPMYALNHYIGQWFLNLFDIDALALEPAWVESLNQVIQQYVGISGISFAAFLVGGNLLGIIISVMLYPIIQYIISAYLSKKQYKDLASNRVEVRS